MTKALSRLALLSLTATAALAVNATTGSSRTFEHDVLLDGKPIGLHRFTLQETTSGVRLDAHAQFVVTLLGLRVFDYDHRIVEVWRGACLERLDATTRQNGRTSQVEGTSEPQAFTVRKEESSTPLDDCVASFAYWDKARLLERSALLNPQTGEYVPVTIDYLGTHETPPNDGGDDGGLAVDRYRIVGRQIDITVAYAVATGEWVALDSRLDNGRALQYRLRTAQDGAEPSPVGEAR